jgi:hypothetical protein
MFFEPISLSQYQDSHLTRINDLIEFINQIHLQKRPDHHRAPSSSREAFVSKMTDTRYHTQFILELVALSQDKKDPPLKMAMALMQLQEIFRAFSSFSRFVHLTAKELAVVAMLVDHLILMLQVFTEQRNEIKEILLEKKEELESAKKEIKMCIDKHIQYHESNQPGHHDILESFRQEINQLFGEEKIASFMMDRTINQPLPFLSRLNEKRRAGIHQLVSLNPTQEPHPSYPFPLSGLLQKEIKETVCHIQEDIAKDALQALTADQIRKEADRLIELVVETKDKTYAACRINDIKLIMILMGHSLNQGMEKAKVIEEAQGKIFSLKQNIYKDLIKILQEDKIMAQSIEEKLCLIRTLLPLEEAPCVPLSYFKQYGHHHHHRYGALLAECFQNEEWLKLFYTDPNVDQKQTAVRHDHSLLVQGRPGMSPLFRPALEDKLDPDVAMVLEKHKKEIQRLIAQLDREIKESQRSYWSFFMRSSIEVKKTKMEALQALNGTKDMVDLLDLAEQYKNDPVVIRGWYSQTRRLLEHITQDENLLRWTRKR